MHALRLVALALPLLLGVHPAFAIGRMMASKASPPPPTVEGAQPVLFVLRRNVAIDCPAPGPADAGADASSAEDASIADDADVIPDSGIDAPADAGPATCEPRHADLVTVTIQPRFVVGEAGSEFALLWATPRAPVVTTAPTDLFERLEALTAPLEIPRKVPVEDESLGYRCDGYYSGGCGGPYADPVYDPPPPPDDNPSGGAPDAGLPDAPTVVGSYEVAVLGTPDPDALIAWLDDHGYLHDADDEQAIGAYVARGWNIVAVRARTDAPVAHGALEPLAFTFEASELVLPVALSRRPAGGLEAVSAFVAADGRYDFPVASVRYAQRTDWVPGTTYLTAMTMWANLAEGPERDPQARRQLGDAEFRVEQYVDVEERVPSSKCPPGHGRQESGSSFCSCRLAPRDRGLPGVALAGAALLVGLLARRRRRR